MEAEKQPEIYASDASENESSNPTSNRTFRDVAAAYLTRRSVLQGSVAVAATSFFAPAPGHAKRSKGNKSLAPGQNKGPLMKFTPLTEAEVAAGEGRMVTVSPDYEYDVLIPWGTPIDPNSGITPYEGDPNTRPSAADQVEMAGIGHDGMFFFPSNLPRVLKTEMNRGRPLPPQARARVLDSRAGFLCVNHEFGNNFHVLGKGFPENPDDVRLSQHAHGVGVYAIRENWRGKWEVASNRNARRITVNTEVEFSGPAAGSPLLANPANNVPKGTVNNCGSGITPWGTYLTCEENFNGYFGSTREDGTFGGLDPLQDEAYGRYGFSNGGFGYGWHVFDPRFDLSNEQFRNESNRFGWIVEIDPFDGTKKPVKRTMLGRFKHEAAAVKELADGRVAVYMGDDQRGDYCYKYESANPWRDDIAAGRSPLDNGTLYVAIYGEGLDPNDGKGNGEWVELTPTDPRIAGAGLDSMDKVVTYARLAADAVGATVMDRPEWSTIGTNGEVYWTMTNNDRKDNGIGAVSEVNPIYENRDGCIIRTDDINSTTFTWEMFLLARNTRATDPGTDDPRDRPYALYQPPTDGGANQFTDPDCAWADDYGRLFIGTDGGQPGALEDQLVVIDTNTGEYRRLLSGVQSDEITGCISTPNYGTLFTNVQHPGDGDPSRTSFPAPFGSGKIPRDCTVVLRRKDGGQVGS